MIEKVYKIMDDMDNSNLIKRLNVVKKSINEDEIAQNLIKKFINLYPKISYRGLFN